MVRTRASSLRASLEAELAALESQTQLRQLAILPEMNFCSNDYLALSKDPRLQQAIVAEMAEGSAVGSTGSRLLSGNARIWETLESELAEFTGAEAALYFNSGYAANVGLLSCVAGPRDTIFSDRANHASIIDGIRLSGARKIIFPHLDLQYLEDKLRALDGSGASNVQERGHKFIVVESVFSMDGDRAPLADLLALAERWGAEMIVDEAHATGVFGEQGRGLAVGASIAKSQTSETSLKSATSPTSLTSTISRTSQGPLAVVHTCGKALAATGAFVSCSETLKRYLINRARTFIFSTALPPCIAAQMRATIPIVAAADSRRAHLQKLATHLRARLQGAGFDSARSDSQIVPVLLGSNERAVHFAAQLCDAGFAVRAIRPPTVPAGTSRLRLSLHAGMSVALLDGLVEALARTREQSPAAAYSAAP